MMRGTTQILRLRISHDKTTDHPHTRLDLRIHIRAQFKGASRLLPTAMIMMTIAAAVTVMMTKIPESVGSLIKLLRSHIASSLVLILDMILKALSRKVAPAQAGLMLRDLSMWPDQRPFKLTRLMCHRQHLYRRHKLPKYQCERCYEMVKTLELLKQHRGQPKSCEEREAPYTNPSDGFTQEQAEQLKDRKGMSRKTVEQKWKDVYIILFPDTDLSKIPPACE